MINILFQYTADVYGVIPDWETRLFRADSIGGFCIELDKPDDWDAIELSLEQNGDVFVIGTYNEDGSLYLWGNEVSRNHTPEKYHQALRPRYEVTGYAYEDVLDENNNVVDQIDKPIITETPYTLEESKQKQVARPPNHAARQLE